MSARVRLLAARSSLGIQPRRHAFVVRATSTVAAAPHNPTHADAVSALKERVETNASSMDLRWEKVRLAWLVLGKADVTHYRRSTLEAPAAKTAGAGGPPIDAADLSDGSVEALAEELDLRRREMGARKKRAVRVNSQAIKRVLRNGDEGRPLVLTRPLALSYMVDILNQLWDESAAAPAAGPHREAAPAAV